MITKQASRSLPSSHHPQRHVWAPLKQHVDDDHDDDDDKDHVVEEVHHDWTPSSSTVRHHEGDEEYLEHEEDLDNDDDEAYLHHPISILRRRSFQSDDDGDEHLIDESAPGNAKNNKRKEDGSSRIASVSLSFDEDEEEELNLRRYHPFQIDQSNNSNNNKSMINTNNNWSNSMNNNTNANMNLDQAKWWRRLWNHPITLQRLWTWWNGIWQAWMQLRQDDRRRRTERLLVSPERNTWDRLQFGIQTWCCDTTNRSLSLVVIGIVLWSLSLWFVSSSDHRPHGHYQQQRHHVMSSTSRTALRRWLLGLGIPLLCLRLLTRPLYWYLRGRHVAAQRRARMEWYDHINQGISESATSSSIKRQAKTSDDLVMVDHHHNDDDDDVHVLEDEHLRHDPYQDLIQNNNKENDDENTDNHGGSDPFRSMVYNT